MAFLESPLMPIQIKVALFADRTKVGTLTVSNDTGLTLAGPFPAYGKADNQAAASRGNPTRNPLFSFGDTPTGGYRGVRNNLAQTPKNSSTYGPQAIITLDPVSGQAKIAKQNGRFGLLIHGGDLNAAGKLRPTFGCVRVANASMVAILAAFPPTERIDVTVAEV